MWTSKEIYKLKQNAVQTLTSGASTSSGTAGSAKIYQGNRILVTCAISDAGDTVDFILPFDCYVLDAFVLGTAAGSTDAEVSIRNGGNAIFGDMDADTADAIVRASTLDYTYRKVTTGTSIQVKSVSEDVSCIVVIDIIPT